MKEKQDKKDSNGQSLRKVDKLIIWNISSNVINSIPQSSQGKAVWNDTVFVQPWTASMNDSSRVTYTLKVKKEMAMICY